MCWCKCCRSLAILPALFAVFCFGTFVITYILVSHDDKNVYPWFFTIGDTLDSKRGRDVFSQMFNLSSFLFLVTLFVRYLQLKHDADWNEESRPLVLRLNKVSFAFGALAALGASLVANFQAGSVQVVHLTGAAMVFFCGLVYCWLQTVISYKMKVCGVNSARLFGARAIFTIAATVIFIIGIANKGYAESTWDKMKHNNTTAHWIPKDAGFVSHVISDASVWFVALFILFFIVTYFGEFKSMKMKLVVSRHNALPMPFTVSDESMRTPLLL